MLARENVEGPPDMYYNKKTLPQDAQKVRPARPQRVTRRPFRGRSHPIATEGPSSASNEHSIVRVRAMEAYVEDFDEPRTMLADFFSILTR